MAAGSQTADSATMLAQTVRFARDSNQTAENLRKSRAVAVRLQPLSSCQAVAPPPPNIHPKRMAFQALHPADRGQAGPPGQTAQATPPTDPEPDHILLQVDETVASLVRLQQQVVTALGLADQGHQDMRDALSGA